MAWLVPSFLASLAGSALLSVVFWYLFIKERESWIRLWALAWTLYTARFAIETINSAYLPQSVWLPVLATVLVLGTSGLLLEGAYHLAGVSGARWHHWLGTVIALWVIAATALGLPYVVITGPAWLYRGTASILSGLIWYRNTGDWGLWGRITGVTFILWGLHHFDYPILRGVEWFAPIGFLLGALFEYVIALGALIAHFEQTRARLAVSEARYSAIFEGSSSVMLLIDPSSGEIMDVNSAAVEFYGWSREQMCRMRIDQVNTLTADEVRAEMARASARDRNHFLFRHRRADGSVVDIESYAGPIVIDGRRLLYSIVHDISKRVEAEAALQESERRYGRLFHGSRSAMLLVDPEGARIVDANIAAEELYGYPADQLKIMGIADLAVDTQDEIDRVVATTIEDRGHMRVFRHVRCDGTEFDAEIAATPIVFAGKTLLYTIISDITERLATEQALHRHRGHLEELVDERTHELSEANKQLEIATRAKDEFMTGMSHELRTPLNSVIGFSDMLLRELPGPLNEEQRRQVDMIGRSGRHLLSIVNDILDLARIEAGTVVVNREVVDVSGLAARLLDGVRPLAAREGVVLRLEVAEGLELWTDERMLEQILWNLVGNAIKFTPGGTVSLGVSCEDERMRFTVCDNGQGMSAEQLEQAFDKFTRFAAPGADEGGTGLGLSISTRLAEYLGGTLSAQSQLGEGSCFTLELPFLCDETE